MGRPKGENRATSTTWKCSYASAYDDENRRLERLPSDHFLVLEFKARNITPISK